MKRSRFFCSALKYISLFVAVALAFSGAVACSEETSDTKTVYALDTVIELRIPHSDKSEALLAECEEIIAEFDRNYSAHSSDSKLSLLNQKSGEVQTVDTEFASLLFNARELSKVTCSAYDYTVGYLSELWAIGDGDAPIPTQEQLLVALAHTGYGLTRVNGQDFLADEGVKIDLGGIAKGYLAEILAERLSEAGVEYGVLSLGGNIAVFGQKPNGDPFKIGIKNPAGGTFGSVSIENGSATEAHFVSVSGTYERHKTVGGVRYHHIIDTMISGAPVENGLLSVAVISESGAEADALSTALFVMGYDGAMEFYRSGALQFEAVFAFEDGRVLATPGCDFSATR